MEEGGTKGWGRGDTETGDDMDRAGEWEAQCDREYGGTDRWLYS